jgi:tetratricopeptide (TPR) repeat protein
MFNVIILFVLRVFMTAKNVSFTRTLVVSILIFVAIVIVLTIILITLSFLSIDKTSMSSKSCYEKANEYYYKGYSDLAEDKVAKCLKKDPNNAESILLHADILVELQEYEKAFKEHDNYFKLKPDDVKTMVKVASAYDVNKKYKEAIDLLKRSIKLSPKNALAYNNLCWILSEDNKYSEGLPYCQKALELTPGEAYILDSMGYTLAGLKQYEEAIDYYNQAISIDPEMTDSYLHLARVYVLIKENKLAIKNYKEFLKRDSYNKQAKNAQQELKDIEKSANDKV